jgi:hypothetical protein
MTEDFLREARQEKTCCGSNTHYHYSLPWFGVVKREPFSMAEEQNCKT